MFNFTAGDDATLVIPFLVDGEYRVPDADSVKYSVRDNVGALIAVLTDVAVTTSTTQTEVVITLPAANTTKTQTVEKRSVILNYTVDGKPFRQIAHLMLHDWLNIVAAPEQVRAFMGLSSTELPDQDIDLYAAYYVLKDELGGTILDDALVSKVYTANQAIVLRACQRTLPSLRQRILQAEQSSTTIYKRLLNLDLTSLEDGINAEMATLLTELTGAVVDYTVPVAFGARTDPVTGA